MKSIISFYKNSPAFKRFVWIVAFITTGFFFLLKYQGNDQLADFQVYRGATLSLLNHTQVYGVLYSLGSGLFKYSPVTLYAFIPLTLLSESTATLIYYFSTACLIFVLAALILKRVNAIIPVERKTGWLLALPVLFVGDHLIRELQLGNINLLLLLIAFIAFACMGAGKNIVAGLLIAILVLFKPHFVILLPWLVLNQKWKSIFTIVISVVAGLLLPAVFSGWQKNSELLAAWITSMKIHNYSLTQSPNTVYSLGNELVGALPNSTGSTIVVVSLLIILAALFLLFMRKNRAVGEKKTYEFVEYFMLIALIPSLTPTDTEHFMWCWPLVVFCMAKLFAEKNSVNTICIVLLAVAFIPFAINSPDLIGKKLSLLFDEKLIGVANLMVLGVSVILFYSGRKWSVACG